MHSLEEVITCLDQSIRQFMQKTPIGGLTFALTDRHHLLHTAHYGYADITAKLPVTAETRFEICSITKTFTSLAVMQQYEAGTLDIHAPITSYLPWFQVQSAYEEPITAHHLMSHTAGLVAGSERSLGSRHAIWLLRETELASAPGTAFHYSDVGYETLGALLETVLQQRFPDILQQQILEPLGMLSSFPSNTYEGRKILALGYRSFYDDRPSHRSHPLVPAPWFEYESPAGCILSTAIDMAAYLRMYLNRGQGPRDDRLLSEKSFGLMIQAIAPGTFGHIGYGLFTQKSDGHLTINHPGGMLGYESMMLGDLDDGVGIVVLLSGKCWPWPWQLAQYGLQLLRAALHECNLSVIVPPGEPKKVANAADYAGTFTQKDRSLTFIAEDGQVILLYQGDRIILEERWLDYFSIPHPDFAYFLSHFGRADGHVVEFEHGADWWIHERYTGSHTFVYPPEWNAYPGHYVSESPWTGHIRIILRKGHLYLVEAEGYERELFQLGERYFGYKRNRVSTALPERVRFDAIIDEQAWCLSLTGNDSYIRVRTP